MALSDWDALAFGPDGKPRAGSYMNPTNNVWIEIYKNWLYVGDESAWRDGDSFVKPTVMQITEGRLNYGGLTIVAARHDAQRAVFTLVSRLRKDSEDYKREYFGGIGCSGYISEVEWYLRHDPERLRQTLEEQGAGWLFQRLQKNSVEYWGFSRGWHEDGKNEWLHGITVERRSKSGRKSKRHADFWLPEGDPDTFVGVETSTYEAWLQWAEAELAGDESGLEWLETVKTAKPLRYNQGDAYLSGVLAQETPATPIGDQQETLAARVIKAISSQTAD